VATVKRTDIAFDSSPNQGDELPGPADLLTAAFAACMLKHVERFITRITYRLEVTTNETAARLDLLHRSLTRRSTTYNTLAAVCDVTGEVVAIPAAS
jgi:organic hydroperoxide reductase OsmC/OhrA